MYLFISIQNEKSLNNPVRQYHVVDPDQLIFWGFVFFPNLSLHWVDAPHPPPPQSLIILGLMLFSKTQNSMISPRSNSHVVDALPITHVATVYKWLGVHDGLQSQPVCTGGLSFVMLKFQIKSSAT